MKVTQPTNENQLVNNRHVTYAGEHYAYMNTSSRRDTSVRVNETRLHMSIIPLQGTLEVWQIPAAK